MISCLRLPAFVLIFVYIYIYIYISYKECSMEAPFVYGRIADDPNFTDRENEVALLTH